MSDHYQLAAESELRNYMAASMLSLMVFHGIVFVPDVIKEISAFLALNFLK
jgi:hypothetical protein